MIEEFELSLAVYTDVLDEKTPFAEALRKRFQADVEIRPFRGLVAGLVGCALRHQIYFDYMTKGLTQLNPEQRRLLCLVLANAFFFRRFDVDETRAMLKEKIEEKDLEACQNLFDLASTPENYIPAEVDRKSPLYLSLRFNVPEWTVKIINHYGGSMTYQSLRKFARPADTTLRVRTSVLALQKMLENPGFSASPVDGIVFYKGNVALRKIPEFKAGQLFPEKLLTKAVLDEHPVVEPGEILLYNGNKDSSLERELIESYGAHIGLNIATPNVDEKPEVSRLIKDKELHNVNFFSAPDVLSMEASVSSMQKLVVVSPNPPTSISSPIPRITFSISIPRTWIRSSRTRRRPSKGRPNTSMKAAPSSTSFTRSLRRKAIRTSPNSLRPIPSSPSSPRSSTSPTKNSKPRLMSPSFLRERRNSPSRLR